MKKYKIIPIVLLISLNMVSVVYSQNDSTWTIRTREGFSINYIAGFKNVYPYYAEINDIKKLKFITNSTVKVTAEDFNEEINIDKINEISFEGGNKMGPGVGIGAIVGFLSGVTYSALLIAEINNGSMDKGEIIGGATIGGILIAIPGAILGGIIGVLIPSEKDSLTLSTVKSDKKDKLMKFLKRNN